jgi:hypothetical protein
LVQGLEIKESMIQAGYVDMSDAMRWYQAKKILRKYESGAEDQRQIMRTLGAGEVKVVSHMLHLALTSRSDGAKVQATAALGKWLGMDKEGAQVSQGVTVIIQAQDANVQVNAGQAAPTNLTRQASGITAITD